MSPQGGYIHQMDVKSAFLNGKFEDGECIYMNPPDDLDLGLKQGQALKVIEGMYGFMRAPRIWSETWNSVIRRLGFGRLKSDECFYFIKILSSTVYVLVYVDDVLILGVYEEAVLTVKCMLMREFEMKDLGVAKSFLGVEFIYTSSGVSLRQEYYIQQVLQKFGMADCKPVMTPASTSKIGEEEEESMPQTGSSDTVKRSVHCYTFPSKIGPIYPSP